MLNGNGMSPSMSYNGHPRVSPAHMSSLSIDHTVDPMQTLMHKQSIVIAIQKTVETFKKQKLLLADMLKKSILNDLT